MTDLTVSKTILSQLGGNGFIILTGSKNFVGSDNALSFKVGSNAKKVTHVRIVLNALDLYDVTYMYVRGTTVKTVATSEGISCDQLQDDFEAETGLFVTMKPRN